MTKKEILFRLIRKFSISKKVYKFLLSNKLSKNLSLKIFNEKYLKYSLKEKEIFHGLTAKLFYDSLIPKGINTNWKLKFCDKTLLIPLETKNLKINWHTAVSVIGTDVEVKMFYKNIIQSNLKPNCFFDIGANFATHSLLFLLHDVKAISFEPNPNCHEFAKKIAKINNLEINIEPIGLGEKADYKQLIFPKDDTGLGSVSDTHILDEAHYREMQKININIKTIDEYVIEKNIIPDLIKIDTEGYEYEVLKGGVNTLLERNVLILFESIDLKQRQLIFEYLSEISYCIYDLRNLSFSIEEADSFYDSTGINFLTLRTNHPASDLIKTFTINQ